LVLNLMCEASAWAAPGEITQQPEAMVERARSLEANKDSAAADELLDKVVQDPSAEPRWKRLAAHVWAARAIRLAPDPDARSAEAIALAARAAKVFQDTKAGSSKDPAILYDIGMCALLTGSDVDLGLVAIAAASHLQSTNAALAEVGARLSEKANKPRQAAELWAVVATYGKDATTRDRAKMRQRKLSKSATGEVPSPPTLVNEASCVGPLQMHPPQYPREAARAMQEGWVSIHFDLASDGKPVNVTVADSSPEKLFDDAAVTAFKKWSFPTQEQSTRKRQNCTHVLFFRLNAR
jgi:TonB family protein